MLFPIGYLHRCQDLSNRVMIWWMSCLFKAVVVLRSTCCCVCSCKGKEFVTCLLLLLLCHCFLLSCCSFDELATVCFMFCQIAKGVEALKLLLFCSCGVLVDDDRSGRCCCSLSSLSRRAVGCTVQHVLMSMLLPPCFSIAARVESCYSSNFLGIHATRRKHNHTSSISVTQLARELASRLDVGCCHFLFRCAVYLYFYARVPLIFRDFTPVFSQQQPPGELCPWPKTSTTTSSSWGVVWAGTAPLFTPGLAVSKPTRQTFFSTR